MEVANAKQNSQIAFSYGSDLRNANVDNVMSRTHLNYIFGDRLGEAATAPKVKGVAAGHRTCPWVFSYRSISELEVVMTLEIRGLAPLLQVYDMPTSIHFYRDLLGFELVGSAPEYAPGRFHWALLRLNGVELMLNTAYEFDDQRPPVREPARVAAHEDTGLFFDCPDVDAAYRYICEQGIAAKPPHAAPYGMKQLYLTDPDGYSLCFQWPV